MEDRIGLSFKEVIQSQDGSLYASLQLLGTGGSAETYCMLATAGPLRGQLFAVKVFRHLSKPAWRDNFLGEITRHKVEPAEDRDMVVASVGPRMPRRYRTPDLIEYLRGGPAPTCQSDVFQIGLVFAEMFSGSNPQRPMTGDDFTEPLQMSDFQIPGGLGDLLRDNIIEMLHMDPANRPSPDECLTRWLDIFLVASDRAHALEGKVV